MGASLIGHNIVVEYESLMTYNMSKPFEANLDLNHSNYYSDSVPFAHDPPGHTCGLPCCNRDLHIHLKLSGIHGGCMSIMPFQPKPQKQDNFTFRQKRAGLIMGRPTFSNKFNSLQPERKSQRRKPVPTFGSLRQSDVSTQRLHELSGNQCHYLKERGITLPRMHVGESSSDTHNKGFLVDSGESSDSSESETDYYTIWECNGLESEIQVKSPSALKNTEKIYPWTLLENAQTSKEETVDQSDTRNNAVPFNNKYGSLPMCYKDLSETGIPEVAQEPVKQSETKVFTLNFDKKRMSQNGKRHTLERTSAATTNNQEKHKTVTIGGEKPMTKSSTLPRSSIRIRPILKNRIENIYTDLITSNAMASNQNDANDEDHNYEKIRDEDLIQSWKLNAKNKVIPNIKPKTKPKPKLKPKPKKVMGTHEYENAGYKADDENEKCGDDGNNNNPITLIL